MRKNLRKYIWIVLGIALITLLVALTLVRNRQDQESRNQTSKPDGEKLSETTTVASNLDTPWDIEFLPDGRMIFSERNGHVYLLENNNKIDLGFVEGTVEIGEGGLLGAAVDPEFELNSFLYFYYTYYRGQDLRNGIVRLRLSENRLVDEFHLLDTIPAANNHNGGGLEFGPDSMLYAATGDATDPGLAQDTNSLAGKVLRLNKDGGTPPDNPFGNFVWAYGLRNPQDLGWQPETGALFATEHGPTRMDEINIIEKGKNYGWPNYECDQRQGASLSNHTPPIACYNDFTLAPSGLAFADSKTLYVGGLRGQQLQRITLNDDLRSAANQEALFRDYGRVRAVAEHQGNIYFGTSNHDGRAQPRLDDDKIIRF